MANCRANKRFFAFLRDRNLHLRGNGGCLPTFGAQVCFVFAPILREFEDDPHRDAMRAYLTDLNARYPQVPRHSGQRSRRPFVGEFLVFSFQDKERLRLSSEFGSVFVFRNSIEAVFFKLKFVG